MKILHSITIAVLSLNLLINALSANVIYFTTAAAGKDPFALFEYYTKQTTHATLVRYTASWCGTCNNTKAQFEKLAQEFKAAAITFIEIDYSLFKNLADKQGIHSLPTYVYYKNGSKILSHGSPTNSTTYSTLKNNIKKYFNS